MPDDNMFAPIAPIAPQPASAASQDQSKTEMARQRWSEALPDHPLLDAYLTGARGIPKPAAGWPDAVRLHPALPYSFWSGPQHPALLLPKTENGANGPICGLHAVFLTLEGRKADLDPPKKSYGSGGVVVLRQGGDLALACEGPEDAITLAAAFPDATIICTAGAGTLHRVAGAVPAGARLVLIADADSAGRDGANRAAQAAQARGIAVAIALPPEGIKDANDIFRRDGLEGVRAMVEGAEPWTPSPAQPAPAPAGKKPAYDWPFRLEPNGVLRRVEKEGKETGKTEVEWVWFCSPLDVVAETRSPEGEDWGRLLRVTDRDGRTHDWAMPMELLAGSGEDYRRRLLSLGLVLSPLNHARHWLSEYIQTARPEGKARCVPRIGWHGRAFVLPDGAIGDTGGEIVLLQTAGILDHAFRIRGSLDAWKQGVAVPAAGNSRLVLALSAAFAGPLLQLTGAESGGLHFRGPSSTGKSTALILAGSVWGGGGLKGYTDQWRATDNALEALAMAHSDTLLCLDELSQIDAKAAGASAYMLGNGAGKARAGRSGEGRPGAKWRVLFLSNGEISLADKLAEDGKGRKATAGQSVRVVDIPAEAGAGLGLFDTIHDAPSADAFARSLKAAAVETYGTAGRAFLEAITKDLEDVRDAVTGHVKAFVARHCPAGADGQVSRVAARFGLIAAAAEIATAAGVLPWPPGEAVRAAARCFRDWIATRGGTGSAEVAAGIAQVRAFIEAHGSSRFEPAWQDAQNGDPRVQNRAGFRRKNNADDWEYYVTTETWTNEVCRGLDARALAKEMIQRGLLTPGTDGKTARSERVPGYGRMRLYHLAASILDGGTHG